MRGVLDRIFAPPEVPPAALARLREVGLSQDPPVAYGMKFVAGAGASYWAITQDWGEHDPRRAAVQSGAMDPAFANDIVATLPGDCSPAEAGAFVERFFKKSADPKKDAIRQVQEAVKQEQATQDANMGRFLIEQEERQRTTTNHDRRLMAGADTAHPMVPGVGDGKKKGKK